jgi:hypothetical protein
MPIEATVTWDPKLEFAEAPIHCESVVKVEEGGEVTKHPFSMDLDSGSKLRTYLNAVNSYGYGFASWAGWRRQEETLGKEVYTITSERELSLGNVASLHQLHYIITRNEEVNHEKYCTFYGSSGVWDTRLCDYNLGSRAEQFLQTLYDMEHCYPTIYHWTNGAWAFVAALKENPSLKEQYDDEIVPILQRMCPGSHSELEDLVLKLKEIPVVKQYDLDSLDL